MPKNRSKFQNAGAFLPVVILIKIATMRVPEGDLHCQRILLIFPVGAHQFWPNFMQKYLHCQCILLIIPVGVHQSYAKILALLKYHPISLH